MALADRVSMPVDRADFDDLVTLVTQAPPWEKDRVQGVRDPAARDRRGQARRARPDPRPLDVAARARDAQGAGPQGQRRVSRRRSGCSARSRTRAATGTRRTRSKLVQRRAASCRSRPARRCSPPPRATRRARTSCLETAREELGTIQEVANALAENLPAPKAHPGRAAPPAAQEEARDARAPQADADGGAPSQNAQADAAAAADRQRDAVTTGQAPTSELSRAMVLAIVFAFVAGLITAVSPCVLPVLPIVLAGGRGRDRRRPFAIIAGLVASFTVSTLFAAWLLDAARAAAGPAAEHRDRAALPGRGDAALPAGRRAGRAAVRPPLAPAARRPRRRLPARRSLGLVFVPCAGPVLAAITAVAAPHELRRSRRSRRRSPTRSARRPDARDRARRPRARAARSAPASQRVPRRVRRGDRGRRRSRYLQRRHAARRRACRLHDVPPEQVEASASAEGVERRRTSPAQRRGIAAPARDGLPDFGAAPDFAGIDAWLNSKPLTLQELRGKVVLVDFWTYSCINCLRTLPHLEAWDRPYREAGLVIVGVHTPEFAFEHVPSNVRARRRSGSASATRSRSTTSTAPGTPTATSTGRPST